jgi:putative transposase
MSRRRRTTTSGTFLITSVAHDRRRIFKVDATARLFLEILQRYRTQALYKLHAFVVMPDHIHLLLTTENLPKAMKHIRGGFSYHLASKLEVWQPDYDDRQIFNEKEYLNARDYIHQNPVRARLVVNAEHFPYSSAYRAKGSDG